MGWDFSIGLDHLNNQVNRALRNVGATEAKMTTDPQRLFAAKAEGRTYDDFIEVWFVATAPVSKGRFIGVIIFDADVEAKVEMLADAGELIFDETRDKVYNPSSRLVQCWGRKVMETQMLPAYYGCPLEYFDKVPARSDAEEKWRKDVRRIASADD